AHQVRIHRMACSIPARAKRRGMGYSPSPRHDIRGFMRSMGYAALLTALLTTSCAASWDVSRPPDFNLPTIDGDRFSLSDHIGRHAILIHFLYMDCAPCLAELPIFAKLQKAYADKGLVVVVLTFEGPELRAYVRSAEGEGGLNFPIVVDTDTSVMRLY